MVYSLFLAERKRLAQLIIAEKQHSLRVLEAAMAEAKAAKCKAKQRERMRYELEHAAEKAAEEVDSKLRNDERHVINVILNLSSVALVLCYFTVKKNSSENMY